MSETFKYQIVEHDGVAVSMCEDPCSVRHFRNSYKSLSLVTEIFQRDCRFTAYKTIAFNEPSIVS